MKVLSPEELKKKLLNNSRIQLDTFNGIDSNESGLDEAVVDEVKKIKKYCIYFLSRREYSASELLQKVKTKDFDVNLAETVIENLQASGMQSDQRFTDMFIRSRVTKLSGPFKLRMELKQKGISGSLIETAMSAAECDWFELALQAAKKKTASWKSFDHKEKGKLNRFLQTRGFEQEQIAFALAEITKLKNDLDNGNLDNSELS